MFAKPSIAIRGHSQIQVSISDAGGAAGPLLEPGTYDVWSDVDMWIKTGTPAQVATVTDATGYFVAAGNVVPVAIEAMGDTIGAISGGAGTLSIHKVG